MNRQQLVMGVHGVVALLWFGLAAFSVVEGSFGRAAYGVFLGLAFLFIGRVVSRQV